MCVLLVPYLKKDQSVRRNGNESKMFITDSSYFLMEFESCNLELTTDSDPITVFARKPERRALATTLGGVVQPSSFTFYRVKIQF